MSDYVSVKIPVVLADKIRSVMHEHGYASVTSFILEATRKLLREIEEKKEKIVQKCRWNEHSFKCVLICSNCFAHGDKIYDRT